MHWPAHLRCDDVARPLPQGPAARDSREESRESFWSFHPEPCSTHRAGHAGATHMGAKGEAAHRDMASRLAGPWPSRWHRPAQPGYTGAFMPGEHRAGGCAVGRRFAGPTLCGATARGPTRHSMMRRLAISQHLPCSPCNPGSATWWCALGPGVVHGLIPPQRSMRQCPRTTP